MRKLRLLSILSASIFIQSENAIGQQFEINIQDAISQSVEVASRAVDDPLSFAGLGAIIGRFNQARVDVSPAGYEDNEWLRALTLETLNVIDLNRLKVDGVSPLPEEEVAEIFQAFDENSAEFLLFYEQIQEQGQFQEISANEMLTYLAAYGVIAYNLDPELWLSLSSFTGVWPLCFWQG